MDGVVGALANRHVVSGTPTTLATFDFAFDDVGNRTRTEARDNPVHNFDIDHAYDELHRLTSSTYDYLNALPDGVESFSLDVLSNRSGVSGYSDTRGTSSSLAYALDLATDGNEYDQIGGVAVGYDESGNLETDENGLSYLYDFEDRLVMVYLDTNADGEYSVGDQWRMSREYDALGRLIRMFDDGSLSSQTTLYYDGDQVLAEYDNTGTLARYYVEGSQYIDEHILLHDVSAGADRYYLSKELHSGGGRRRVACR